MSTDRQRPGPDGAGVDDLDADADDAGVDDLDADDADADHVTGGAVPGRFGDPCDGGE